MKCSSVGNLLVSQVHSSFSLFILFQSTEKNAASEKKALVEAGDFELDEDAVEAAREKARAARRRSVMSPSRLRTASPGRKAELAKLGEHIAAAFDYAAREYHQENEAGPSRNVVVVEKVSAVSCFPPSSFGNQSFSWEFAPSKILKGNFAWLFPVPIFAFLLCSW